MSFACSILKSVLVYPALLAAVFASASAAAAASSCELPKINLLEPPNEAGAPTKIALGIVLIDITEIDDVKQQFSTDFAVFQTWTDPRLTHLGGCRFDLSQIWSPDITFMHSGRIFPAWSARASVDAEGVVRYTQRYQGSLSFRHALQEFPFDKHTIRIGMIPVRDDRHAYQLVVDENRNRRVQDFTILDWTFGEVSARIAPFTHVVTGQTVEVF